MFPVLHEQHTLLLMHAPNGSRRYTQTDLTPARRMELSVGYSHRVFNTGGINLLMPITVSVHYLVKCISSGISCSQWYYNADLLVFLNERILPIAIQKTKSQFITKRSPFDFLKSILYGLESHVQTFLVFKKRSPAGITWKRKSFSKLAEKDKQMSREKACLWVKSVENISKTI